MQTVAIKYLEKGHTSMSADAIHQVVNKFLAKAPVEDFTDYVRVCARSGRVVEMTPSDFRDIVSGISAAKMKQLAGEDLKPMLNSIRVVQARRGDDRLFLKTSHDQKTWKAYDIMKTSFDPCDQPQARSMPRGINKDKLQKIRKSLLPLVATHKRKFWDSLVGKNVRDLNG